MIRLILCDIDGTLLHGSETELDPRYFDEIKRLRKKGILFAPATGRQYFGVRQLFAPVADEIYCLSENGTAIFSPEDGGTLLASFPLDPEDARSICRDAIAIPRCRFLATAPRSSYALEGYTEPVDHLVKLETRHFDVVPTLDELPADVCKISLFCMDGLEATHAVEDILTPRYRDRYNIAIAGTWWLDFTTGSKAKGAELLCDRLGIGFSEVMAIGDNYNDADLLALAGRGYIMENAEQPLKDRFPLHCENVLELLQTL